MADRFVLLVPVFLLAGCFGLKTEQPLCKAEVLADITGFSGAMTIAGKRGNVRGLVERLERGIYLVREEHPTRADERPFLAMRFCRLNGKIYAEYQNYERKTKTLSRRSFWPQEVLVKNGRFHFYLVDTSIFDLDRLGIAYYLFPRQASHRAQGFIVLNPRTQTDLTLAKILHKLEDAPNTVIDFQSRHIFSPLLGN